MPSTFERVQQLALSLPEAERVDIEACGGEPTFRIRGKNVVVANLAGSSVTVKPSTEEATAVLTDDGGSGGV